MCLDIGIDPLRIDAFTHEFDKSQAESLHFTLAGEFTKKQAEALGKQVDDFLTGLIQAGTGGAGEA
jgi:hypothetical protein